MSRKEINIQASCSDAIEFGSLRADDARQQILNALTGINGIEKVNIRAALNRVLAEEIVSPWQVPPHTNSAVDGFAIRHSDLETTQSPMEFVVSGTAFAGTPFHGTVEQGHCVQIMTGAPIPAGTDTVLMQEHIDKPSDKIRPQRLYRGGENVRHAGEDIQKGETILESGRLCMPADIGLLASLGIGEIKVKPRLRVAIFSTGNEIQTIGGTLGEGEIFDSNRFTLGTALERLGVEVLDLGVIGDNPEALSSTFKSAAECADVIISTGGVSVGKADYIRAVLKNLGGVEFWKVAIKPGRPMAFGTIEGTTFFGLPGNPVAVLVTFYQFVLPALEKQMGITSRMLAPKLTAQSTCFIRKRPGRTEFQRGILEQSDDAKWLVRTTGRQGSGILRSMSLANAFLILPHDGSDVNPGDSVLVQPFAGLI